MKLKLVVASMSVLGLISCPVLADTQTKHKHHHHHHRMVSQTTVVEHGYKDMAMPVAEVCPKVDMYDSMLDMMSHNVGRAKSTIHCTDPLSLAGGIAFDSTWGNRHQGYAGENTSRFSLNDAYVNVYGNVNNWTTAFASLSYANFQPYASPYNYTVGLPGPAAGLGNTSVVPVGGGTGPNNSYTLSGVYSNSYARNKLQLEQGYITFKNMSVMPLFLRIGKMFTDFNRYSIHPMTQSLTQVMSESLQTAVQLGFMTNFGLNGSVYTFENPMRQFNPTGSSNSHNKNNYGVSLNWNHPSDMLGYDVGVGYMNDFTGVDQFAYDVALYNGSTLNSSGQNGSYQSRIGGVAVYADLNTGPFTFDAHYVTATSKFSASDLPTKTRQMILAGAAANGAQPWSADITAGFGFNAFFAKDQNVYLGYQASGNAVNMFLPKSRWLAGYGINILKSTTIGAQFNHDTAYSTSSGGTGHSSNALIARAAVQFG
jgi:hypothetical protein